MKLLPPLEAILWIGALFWLAVFVPESDHFTFCILSNLSFDWCPGCGLGHSISLLFHGDLAGSFKTHPLAIPAVLILLHRSTILLYKHYKPYGKSY